MRGSEDASDPHEHCPSVSRELIRYFSDILRVGKWHGRGRRFDPDQVHQIPYNHFYRKGGPATRDDSSSLDVIPKLGAFTSRVRDLACTTRSAISRASLTQSPLRARSLAPLEKRRGLRDDRKNWRLALDKLFEPESPRPASAIRTAEPQLDRGGTRERRAPCR